MANAEQTELRLTADEALVVYEFLWKLLLAEGAEPIAGDPERIALSAVLGQLERSLEQPFAPDYRELLASARRRLSDQIPT